MVYGEHGLGKSQTIQWWVDKNDSVYVRANQGMTSRWLLSEIAEELGEEPYWHTQETFELIENHLRNNPKTIIVDLENKKAQKHTETERLEIKNIYLRSYRKVLSRSFEKMFHLRSMFRLS